MNEAGTRMVRASHEAAKNSSIFADSTFVPAVFVVVNVSASEQAESKASVHDASPAARRLTGTSRELLTP